MRIVVLVGLPGSGKSTYLDAAGVGGLSSDAIRKLLADDETDQTIHVAVFRTLRFLLYQRIAIGRPVSYIDATNLTREERSPYLRIGKVRQCEVEAVFFDVPLAVCRERNARRHRMVPDEAMLNMAAKLVAPTVDEGFSKITVVRPGGGGKTVKVTRRAATAEDEAFLYDLITRNTADALGASLWPEHLRDSLLRMQYHARQQGIAGDYPQAGQEIILADGSPAGRLVVSRNEAEIRVVDIAVLPERQNRGIGGAVVQELIEESNRTGKPVRLTVTIMNPAIRFYENLGFRRIGGDQTQHFLERTPTQQVTP